ncbi:MAG: ATP-binding protein [Nitrospirota bacterium]
MQLNSIRTKILLSQLGIVLFVSFVMGILSIILMKHYLETAQREKLEFIANEKANAIEHYLSSRKALMERIAEGRELVVYKKKYDDYTLTEYLNKFKNDFPVLSYVNEKGVEELKLVHGMPSFKLRNVGGSAPFQTVFKKRNQAVMSPVEYSPEIGKPVLNIALGKYGYFGDEFIGVLVGAVPLDLITETISETKIGKSGFCSLIGPEGNILFYPGDDRPLRSAAANMITSKEVMSDIKSMRHGFGKVSIFGIESFIAYAPVKETEWTLLSVLPYSEFISAPNTLRNTFIIAFIVVFAVAVVVTHFISGNISRPVMDLADAARAVAKGDLDRMVPVKSDDEVGILTVAFNDMVENLKEFHDDLVSAVRKEKAHAAELKKAYDELRDTQSMLVQSEKLAALGELGAGMAHELNNPLAGVLSLVRSMMKGKDTNSLEYSDLKDIEEACSHMATIIRDVNTYARKSTGEITALNITDVIESTLSFAAPQLKKKGIEIERDYESGIPMVKGNMGQLRQVVLNMITNARDAIDGRGKLKISTRLSENESGGVIKMEFSDTGGGIGEEELSKIFDPFYTTKRPGKGIGLGLAISQTLVRNHNGDIQVKSSPGKGTTFTVVLPVSGSKRSDTAANA